jgi:hypothetical protein
MEKQVQEQPEVIFGIEKSAFIEQKVHSPGGIASFFQGKAAFSFSTYKHYVEAGLAKAFRCFIHSLVSDQVVGYGYDGFFQIPFFLLILFNESVPHLLHYDFSAKIR